MPFGTATPPPPAQVRRFYEMPRRLPNLLTAEGPLSDGLLPPSRALVARLRGTHLLFAMPSTINAPMPVELGVDDARCLSAPQSLDQHADTARPPPQDISD